MRAALVLAVGLALAGAASTRAEPPLLVGTVGPFFTIEVDDAQGNRVTHLDPGVYTLLVHDRSPGHNFHIYGAGGLDEIVTTPEFVGDRSLTVTLVDGIYAYQCDPHAGEMSGGFTVGNVPAATPKKPVVKKKKPPPKRKR